VCYVKTKIKIPKTILIPVVICGCETWSLKLCSTYAGGVSEKGVEENIWS
jgi:hypothetical protein